MPYKILSLDGGGSWALIQARVLTDIYGDIRGHELLRQFDMAIANSGGSLVLAALCNDMKISEIISVFKDKNQRMQVFSRLSFWEKLKWQNIASLTNVLGPKYSTERKLKGLINVLKSKDHLLEEGVIKKAIVETPLNELPAIIKKDALQLVIVGFDYFRERATFFRSNTKSLTDKFNQGKFFQISLAHAIHSSSNAPVNYFDAPAEININLLNGNDNRKTWYWDGAVSGFNNPILAGLIEAITNNYQAPQNYCILSIGTGTGSKIILTESQFSTNPTAQALYTANKNNDFVITDSSSGFIKDVKKVSSSVLDDPPDSATFIAYSILDPSLSNKANLIRINPCINPVIDNSSNKFVPPEVYKNMPDKFKALLELAMDAVEDNQVDLISELCDKFIVTDDLLALPNQLIRGSADNNGIYLGHPTYKEAKNAWLNVCK